ncbi:template-activating factor I [Nematocida minor]|uniref:template-activating factor I n=1 Tax=Nematocida minor TaxID=1912983 RepID=UPI00221ECF2E|nr:template-activating factor I [Nematocida minor]KAI5190837.1 template-activating factor I [Nematocida minor]
MNPNDALKELVEIQSKIDLANIEALKQEYLLKLEHFNGLKETLNQRNILAKEIEGFWESVLVYSDFVEILQEFDYREGQEEASVDISWIESISVEYRPDFKYYIGVKAKENEYFENAVLEKEFSLFESADCINTSIQWKNKKLMENPLLKFFSSSDATDDDSNMSMFQILSDIYFNAVYYYVRLDGEESEEKK